MTFRYHLTLVRLRDVLLKLNPPSGFITVPPGDDRPTNPVFLYFTLNFYLDWFP